MFTSEDLYEVCCRALLESPQAYYSKDAHYLHAETEGGAIQLNNYLDISISGFQLHEEQETQRLQLLRERRSYLHVTRLYVPKDKGFTIARWGNIADGFVKSTLLEAPGSDSLKPNDVTILFEGNLVSDPYYEPWFVEVYEALKSHL